ncbi:MAG: TRAP transporter fused permease subunit [Alphaproteobacteria bacterium]|nr:TRAP transporter fused permease subunit [Alphaproteobacteria bacterium]
MSIAAGVQAEPGDAPLSRAWLLLGLAYVLFHLAAGSLFPLSEIYTRTIHLGLSLILLFLPALHRAAAARPARSLLDWGITIAGVAAAGHVFLNEQRLSEALFIEASGLEMAYAVLLLAIVLEGARRTTGAILPILALLLIGYTLLGKHIPGWWGHPGIEFSHFVEHLYLGTEAFWGRITGLSAGLIAVFIIFGHYLLATGAADSFMRLSLVAAGRSLGGAAKVATLSSAFFGMINGAAVANVATTGNFTIPAMKRLGYRPAFAGAVEAVASSGGQLTPPIMGTAAFVMAELLELPYATIAAAAIVPAILFYVTIWFAVDVEARREGLKPFAREDVPRLAEALRWRDATALSVTVGVLLYGMFSGITLTLAAAYAIGTNILLYLVIGRSEPEPLAGKLRNLLFATADAARSVATLVPLLVCAQVILSLIGLTGIGIKLSELILSTGTNQGLFMASLLAMLVSIVLGMGMPTTAAYLLAAAVCAPAMTALGAPALTAHFFIFYGALLSALTPPVCTAVYTAAVITGTHWWPIALVSMKLGIMKFVLPFFFVYRPAVLLDGTILEIATATVIGCVAAFLFAVGTGGFYRHALGWPLRLLAVGAALGGAADIAALDLAAIAALAVILLSDRMAARAMPAEPDRP